MTTVQLFSFLSTTLLLTACEGPMVERNHYTITKDYNSGSQENSNNSNDIENDEDIKPDQNSEETEPTEEIPTLALEVITLAGSGEYASIDGKEETAAFAAPKVIRLRNDGILIVADSGSGAIRMVDPEGNASTIDLSGEVPISLSGLAIANDGTIYVSDYQQHCIFKIEESISEVYAGTCGVSGAENGEVEDALFNQPRGLALKDDGALYIADSANNLIRMIDPKGNVHTIAGSGDLSVEPSTGPALEADIYIPFSLALHPSGDIYFSGFDHCIRRVHDGYVEDIAGLCQNHSNTGNDDGDAFEARFDTPADIVFTEDESLLIVDAFNDRIRMLSSDLGTVNTVVGTTRGFTDGDSNIAQFDTPRSITVDDQDNIYVADSINNRIRVVLMN